jgi:hypothetical protein
MRTAARTRTGRRADAPSAPVGRSDGPVAALTGGGGSARSRIAVLPAVAVLALAATVAGCAPTKAGSAAVVGGTAISERGLQNQVRAYLDTLPAATRAKADASLATVQTGILAAMIDEAVVGQVAKAKGVVVSQAAISARVQNDVTAGGSQLDSQLAALYLTRATLPAFEQTNLQFIALRGAIGAGKLSDTAAQTKVFDYVVAQAKKLPVQVSPRYGTWDAQKLTVSGGPQSISTPAASASSTAAAQ